MKKFLLSIALLLGISASVLAQNSDLQGTWTLKKMKDHTGTISEVPGIFYKVYHADGTFSNLSLREGGLKLSHKGIFNLSRADSKYDETVQHTDTSQITTENTTNNLKISFSEDGKLITLEGVIKLKAGTYNLYEVWSKID